MARLIGEQPFTGCVTKAVASIAATRSASWNSQIAFALKRPDLLDAVQALPEELSVTE
jgi:hypothetical protein